MAFSISIENLRFGWLQATLSFAERKYEFDFSDVSNDALRELAQLGLFLVSDEHFGCEATFWLEPAGYELQASRSDELRLNLRYAEHAFSKLFPPITTVDSISVDGTSCAREIARALRRIQPQLESAIVQGPETKSWNYTFPLELVLQVEQAIA